MKATLTLSTVLLTLTLASAVFANGAQEQTEQAAAPVTNSGPSVAVTAATVQKPEAAAITRSVLQRLEADIRQDLLGSLRERAMQVLQYAAPVLIDATGISATQLEMTRR